MFRAPALGYNRAQGRDETMYMPRAFREDRTDVLLAAMRGIGSAAVVSDGPDGLLASHVPIEVDPEPAPWGTIRCHFARPNPQVKAIVEGRDLLFIFQGPQAYVSPYWYPTKRRTGKVVPTLNYVAIHAYGTVSGFLDGDGLRAHLAALTDRFGGPRTIRRGRSATPPPSISTPCAGPLPASGSRSPASRANGNCPRTGIGATGWVSSRA